MNKFIAAIVLITAQLAIGAVPGGTSAVAPSTTRVVELKSPEQVKSELAKPGPVVLLYSTEWCGACKAFKPTFDSVSNLMTDVRFYRLDADKLGLKEHAGKIKYVPTIYVGRSEKTLREQPCEIGKEGRSSARIKLDIINCLGTLPND